MHGSPDNLEKLQGRLCAAPLVWLFLLTGCTTPGPAVVQLSALNVDGRDPQGELLPETSFHSSDGWLVTLSTLELSGASWALQHATPRGAAPEWHTLASDEEPLDLLALPRSLTFEVDPVGELLRAGPSAGDEPLIIEIEAVLDNLRTDNAEPELLLRSGPIELSFPPATPLIYRGGGGAQIFVSTARLFQVPEPRDGRPYYGAEYDLSPEIAWLLGVDLDGDGVLTASELEATESGEAWPSWVGDRHWVGEELGVDLDTVSQLLAFSAGQIFTGAFEQLDW